MSSGDHEIRSSVISGCTSYGISVNSLGNIQIAESVITGNGTGIYVSSGSPLIENNLIVENSNQGIHVYNTSSQPTIRYNTIDLNGDYGLYFYYPSYSLIYSCSPML